MKIEHRTGAYWSKISENETLEKVHCRRRLTGEELQLLRDTGRIWNESAGGHLFEKMAGLLGEEGFGRNSGENQLVQEPTVHDCEMFDGLRRG